MLDWIKDGMKVDYHMIAEKMHRTMEGNVVNSIRNFEKRNKIELEDHSFRRTRTNRNEHYCL